MSLSLFLARRLSLNASPTTGSAAGSRGMRVAVTGITLSIAVMIVSICVMRGFSRAIREKVSGFEPQLTIGINPSLNQVDVSPLVSVSDVESALSVLPPGARASMSIKQPAILKTPDNFSGVIIKGMDRACDTSFLADNLVEGSIPDYSADSTIYQVVASRKLLTSLGLGLGDRIDCFFMGDRAYRTRRLKVAGIYDTHFSGYDMNYVFSSIDMLRGVAAIADTSATVIEINSLQVSGEDLEMMRQAVEGYYLQQMLTGKSDRRFTVLSVNQTAAQFFSWLELLDTNVVVILVIMSLLSLLTLVSSLFILVLRHVPTIGLLKALGASNRQIRFTFILITGRILLRGLLLGNLLGLTLVIVQMLTRLIPLDPEAYYLDHVPVQLSLMPILVLNIAVTFLAFITLLLPSAIISTVSPSRAIRYE